MPQFTEELVRVGRIVPGVATAMLEGISMDDLWWKSGSTTGALARSAPTSLEPSSSSTAGLAGASRDSKTRAEGGRRSVVNTHTSTYPSPTRRSCAVDAHGH